MENKINYLKNRYYISPSYSIKKIKKSDNRGIELTIDLPGVRKEDISVQLEDNGHYLRISGKKYFDSFDGDLNVSEFNNIFRIDEWHVEIDKMDVSLENGVLRVVAPEKNTSVYESVRKLPIVDKNKNNELSEEDKGVEKNSTNEMTQNDTPQAESTAECLDGLTITTDEE